MYRRIIAPNIPDDGDPYKYRIGDIHYQCPPTERYREEFLSVFRNIKQRNDRVHRFFYVVEYDNIKPEKPTDICKIVIEDNGNVNVFTRIGTIPNLSTAIISVN